MAGPIVIRDSLLLLNYGAPALDISCHVVAFELTANVEEVDIGTFCNPSATETGRVTYSALLALLWSPALYTQLQPHVGAEGTLFFHPDAAVITDYVSFLTRFAALPWGRFELGQRVEVDLPLAVLETPTWTGTGTLGVQTLPASPPASPPAEPAAEPAATDTTPEVTPS